jgi:putative DNA primase/helicase
MQFVKHDPNHLQTKQANVNYDPTATCPKWEQFVSDVMGGNQEMIAYLRRCCGYTLTGDTGEQCFFVLWGPGGTGKSTFLNVMRGILGTYCATADPEMFMVKRGDSGQPFDMAGLEGVRMLMAIETEEGKKIATAKLKRMTGQDPIKACYKFREPYEFMPVWKLWLATNDAPQTRADDDAFWERAKPIPFTVKFRGTDKQIKDYAEVLVREEGSGILNWMLKGLEQYQQGGLQHPKTVKDAANEWRDRDDWLARFLEEHTEPTTDKQQMVKKSDLFPVFTRWADETKQARGVNDRQFSEAMKRKGYEAEVIKRDGKTPRVWIGLRLFTLVERGVGSAISDQAEL